MNAADNDNGNDSAIMDDVGAVGLPEVEIQREHGAAHRALRHNFERVERAIGEGRYDDAKERLGGLIDLLRAHFSQEELLAKQAGLANQVSGRLIHKALLSRAQNLHARFETDLNRTHTHGLAQQELVGLMMDLLETDQRLSTHTSQQQE